MARNIWLFCDILEQVRPLWFMIREMPGWVVISKSTTYQLQNRFYSRSADGGEPPNFSPPTCATRLQSSTIQHSTYYAIRV